jgi:hypothetical protein
VKGPMRLRAQGALRNSYLSYRSVMRKDGLDALSELLRQLNTLQWEQGLTQVELAAASLAQHQRRIDR